MKLTIAASCFLAGLAASYLLISMGVVTKLAGPPSVPGDQSQSLSIYLSFVGVMLTAVTVVLAALAIGIGVIAAYTIAELKTSAKKVANEVADATAKTVAADALSEVKIREMFATYVSIYEKERTGGIEWGPETENEDR